METKSDGGQPDIVVECRDVWFSYGRETVLSAVDMVVRRGEFIAVIGPNGGGKTTLIRLILGRLSPTRGEIRIMGGGPGGGTSRIGYCAQNTAVNLSFPVTALDVVLMGRIDDSVSGIRYSKRDRDVAMSSLERVGMAGNARKKIGDLSGGQLQRVILARALATEPEILLLDEPTANIDTVWQMKIYDLLRELGRDMTVIVAGHDVTGLLGEADRIAYVNRELHIHDAPQVAGDLADAARITPLQRLCPVELLSRIIAERN